MFAYLGLPYRLIYAYQGTVLYLLRFEHRKEVYK
jgi:mRNA-degrading endonuclease RelE of RelBE toxin-antitoxin system